MGFETSPLLVGIDYFRLAAQAVGMIGLLLLLVRVLSITATGKYASPIRYEFLLIGSILMAAGAGALLIFALGWGTATMGWIETGSKAPLDGSDVLACLLEIGLGGCVIGLPRINDRFGNWLDRRYPKA